LRHDDATGLERSIRLPQAVALYVGAVVGAGVLILPGAAADEAGPASLIAWGFDGLLGIPIALTFARLAARFPDAGGVAVYATRAFGAAVGASVGWFYFVAAAVAQSLVVLTGAHYAADAASWGRLPTFVVAGAILAAALSANLLGLRVSAGLQLVVAAAVASVLGAAAIAALPELSGSHLHPFLPHGWAAVGRAGILLFFAFFGWEAITHLSAEFHNPSRDVPLATVISVGLITVIYLAVAFAVIGTGTYGDAALNRVAVGHVLGGSLGVSAESAAAVAAVVISLATANAFVAATSRLGYALARDDRLPRPLARLSRRGVPSTAVVVVGAVAAGGLVIAYLRHWGAEAFLVVPNSLVIVVYLVGMAAGARLLHGPSRLLAVIATVLCFCLLPFAGVSLALPLGLAIAAVGYSHLRTAGRWRLL